MTDITLLESIGLTFVFYLSIVSMGVAWAAFEAVRVEGPRLLFISMFIVLLVALVPLIPAFLIYYFRFLWS